MTQVGRKGSCIALAKNSSYFARLWRGVPSGRKSCRRRFASLERSTDETVWCQGRCYPNGGRSDAEQARRRRLIQFLEGEWDSPFTGIGRGENGTEPAATPPTPTSNPAVMSSLVPPSRKTLLHLYAATLRASRGFSSYNFRNYFLARTKDAFRGIQVRGSPTTASQFHALTFRPDPTE